MEAAVFEKQNIQETVNELKSDAVKGLTDGEAFRRLQQNGRNEMKAARKKTKIQLFLEQLKDPLIYILLIAAVVSVFLGELSDAVIIGTVVVVNALVGMLQEGKARKALEALKKLTSPQTIVIRDGIRREIPAAELVTGDLVDLEAGAQVPADIRLTRSSNLQVEESSLTGESVPVEKDALFLADCRHEIPLAERVNMVYMSTVVTHGHGEGIVTATGMATEIGRIASMITDAEEEMTPLQKRLGDMGKLLSILSLGVCAALFLLAVFQHRNIPEMLLVAISLAVAAVPEGLPAVVTICLALSVTRMVKVHTIIRRLPSVETLGAVSVVCSDKTGTLTQNRMTVRNVYSTENEETLLRYFLLCNNQSGPLEHALIHYGASSGLIYTEVRKEFPVIEEIPFDSIRKRMTTLHRTPNGYLAITKGAPEFILANCHSYLDKDGSTRPLTHTMRHRLNEQIENYTANALRVIALGFCLHKSRPDNNSLESHLVFLGMAGLIDPPRPEAYAAVKSCQHAGIRPIMITGDHKNTAAAIGKELGICQTKDEVITGADLDTISDRSLPTALKKYHVFARVSPAHKVRLVKGYQAMGNVVAMTGDGVNDAPALKAADIGCAMGRTGTDVAKNASDIILMDDNFSTIVSAVREGRGIYDNIKKAIHFLLSCNIGEIMTIFVAIFFGLSAPLLPVQLLFINLVTDSFPALCLGVEPPDPDSMNRPPLSKNESIFHFDTVFQMVLEGMFIGSLALFAYTSGNSTMCFAVLSLSQLVHSFNMRSEHSLLETGILGNKKLLFSVLFCIVLQCLVICMPVLQPIFHTQSLNLREWVVVGILSLMPIPLMEISKRLHG